MEVSDEIWDLVNLRKATEGFIATSDKKGRCDAACIGSLQLSDRETMTMLVGESRTLENLKQNPRAVFITAQGAAVEDVRGCRVYLEVMDIVEKGPVIDKGREMLASAVAPETATERIKAFVTLNVTDVRPLIDNA
jgi:Pyridoxamine 5'-phosphate oxidase